MTYLAAFSLLFFAHAGAEPPPASFETRLAQAAQHYDLDGAVTLANDLRVRRQSVRDIETAFLLARALLLVADLERTHYELTPEADAASRRAHGDAIDAAAFESLELLEAMGETSEVWRMRADLYGVMIRSDYRATRYRKRMNEAVARALALDEHNPRAHVSAARPLVFADAEHGQDLEGALKHLDAAVALDPGLESARVLKAATLEKLERAAEAKALWQELLDRNPDCLPARRRLEQISGP